MRAVYRSMPSEKVVAKELRRLARELEVPQPGLTWWSRGDGQYDSAINTIRLPSPEWIAVYDPDLPPINYWIMVLHEFAHHLDFVWNDTGDHSPLFYAILTSLALSEDIPMDVFYTDEHAYKPGSFKRGRALTGRHILWKLKIASYAKGL